MPLTWTWVTKGVWGALDEVARRGRSTRSAVIRSAISLHADTHAENCADREIGYEAANLEQVKQALGRVLARYRQHPAATDQHEVSVKVSAVRELIWTAFLLADTITVDEHTAPGPVPAQHLSSMLDALREQLRDTHTAAQRIETAAAGRTQLPNP